MSVGLPLDFAEANPMLHWNSKDRVATTGKCLGKEYPGDGNSWRGLRPHPNLFCRTNGFAAVSRASRRSGSPTSVRRSVGGHLSIAETFSEKSNSQRLRSRTAIENLFREALPQCGTAERLPDRTSYE